MPYKRFLPAREAKVKAVCHLQGVYPMYQPVIGNIYDGVYCQSTSERTSFCVIPILDKQIVLRLGEFEIVGE